MKSDKKVVRIVKPNFALTLISLGDQWIRADWFRIGQAD